MTERVRTYVAKGREAEALQLGAAWFVIDATDQVLGRLATRVARTLIGKDKASFTPYLDSGDHVIVINADKIRLTGNKAEQKVYYSHSGYPGGLKQVAIKRLRPNRSDWIVRSPLRCVPTTRRRTATTVPTSRSTKRIKIDMLRPGYPIIALAESPNKADTPRALKRVCELR